FGHERQPTRSPLSRARSTIATGPRHPVQAGLAGRDDRRRLWWRFVAIQHVVLVEDLGLLSVRAQRVELLAAEEAGICARARVLAMNRHTAALEQPARRRSQHRPGPGRRLVLPDRPTIPLTANRRVRMPPYPPGEHPQ